MQQKNEHLSSLIIAGKIAQRHRIGKISPKTQYWSDQSKFVVIPSSLYIVYGIVKS